MAQQEASRQSSVQSEPRAYQQLATALASRADTQPTQPPAAQQNERVFRKGGTMTALGEYIAEGASISAPVSRKSADRPHRLGPQITASNVGYQLLQKAGWQEGQGIGVNQQGRAIPLAAYHQQSRHGIGAGGHAEVAKAGHKRSKEQPDGKETLHSPEKKRQRQAQPVPNVPEEPVVKQRRHQQILQAEADDAAGKAISQYMYRAFNDLSGVATTDSNPLVRRNKLSSTNPLL